MSKLLLFSITGALVAGAFYLGRVTAPETVVINQSSTFPAPAALPPAPGVRSSPTPESTEHNPKGSSPRDILSKLRGTVGSEQHEDERLRLLAEWAATDPAAALQYAKANFRPDRQTRALTAVFTSWVHKAPEAAWKWAVDHLPGETQHLNMMIGEVGKSDPALAARLAQDYAKQHPEVMQELMISAVQGMSYSGRFEEAKKIVESLPLSSEDDRVALVSFLAGQWGHYQPERVAGWIQAMPPGQIRDQALSNLGEAWSDANPAQAADYAVKLPPGMARQNALRQAISKWVSNEPDQARAWVMNSEHHEDFDQALVSIATDYNLVTKEPERALRWASTIFDDELRFQSLSSVLGSLYARDPQAALNYTRTSPDLTPEQRTLLQQQLLPANHSTPSDPAFVPGTPRG